MDSEADCKQQLQREQNSIIELMSSVLSRAFLEWILMFLLYINALFSFLVTQFARVCKLQTPCLLCSRLDHILLQGPAHYNDLICHSHRKQISNITCVEKKNDSTLKQCYCSVPFEFKPPPQAPKIHNSINEDDNRMMVKKTVRKSGSNRSSEGNIDEMHEERRPRECIKPEPISLMLPAGDTVVDSSKGSETVSKGNFESIDDKLTGSGNLITPTSTIDNSVNEDDKRMMVKKTVRNSDSDHPSKDNIDEMHEERRPHECTKPEPISLMLPAGDIVVDSSKGSKTVSKENFGSIVTGSGNLITPTSTIDNSVNEDDKRMMVKKTIENSDSDHPSKDNIDEKHEERKLDEKHEERIPHECIKPEPVSLMLPAGLTIVDSTKDSKTVSEGNLESIGDKLTGSGNLIAPTSTSDHGAITSQTTRDMGYNMDLNDAYKLATGSKSTSVPSPTVTQVLTGKDSSKVYEDLRLLVSQFSAARGLESPWTELSSPSPRVLHDPSNNAILEHITKSLSIDRNESGLENLDRSSSIVTEIEGESAMDRLKRQIELDRKSMYLLYKELEEERNASAVAACQAMAMITRLQEEKASMHMEALQYQREMEEQSEYDQEAILKLNQVVLQRENEVRDLEAQLAYFRKMAGDDFVPDEFEKRDV